jgi:beta-galactosidase
VNGYYNTDLADSLDVVGFNYNYQKADDYRKEHPKRLLIGTETGSDTYTRGIYSTDKLRNWMSSYNELRPDTSLDQGRVWWRFYAERPWLSGGFMWTGFDYRGEPSPYSWPSISSQFGVVDTCGFPKDSFFYYKAWWSDEPVLHLFPHWNWEGREGEEICVQVESNVDSVELFLNGRTLGSKKVMPYYPLEWKVRYAPGVIEARGTKAGKVVLTQKRETAGAQAQIKLSADRTEIRADGQDVGVVRVEVVDEKGRCVPIADNLIQFKVSGEGTLIGVGNGDPNCHESDKGDRRSLFNGLAQALVQATRNPGSLTIEAASEGLASAILTITTRQAKKRSTVL